MKRINKPFDKLSSKIRTPFAFVAIFALIGTFALIFSQAATPSASIEPEQGNVAVPASIYTDGAASGGQIVKFGTAAAGGNIGLDNTCKMYSATNPTFAFCDGFNVVTPFDARYSRSGDLNGQIWGASRIVGGTGQGALNPWAPAYIEGCGSTAYIQVPHDIRICNGRLFEATNDGHDQTTLAMYPKQPFNWAGRTGTVVFDMSLDHVNGHGAWPEFWITDKPIPAPHGDTLSGQGQFIRHGLGFTIRLDACNGAPNGQLYGVDKIAVIRNYVPQEWNFDNGSIDDCVKPTSSAGDANINHFEIQVSQNSIKVYGTDPGSTQLKLLAHADNVNLSFSQGLVWMNDVHYNADKDPFSPHQSIHTMVWDNLGFDGPKTYRDLAYDVPDSAVPNPGRNTELNAGNPTIDLGYSLDGNAQRSFTLPNITWRQWQNGSTAYPTGALVTFNWSPSGDKTVPSVRVNGGAWVDTPWPFVEDGTGAWRAMVAAIPMSDVHTGSNTIEFKNNGGEFKVLSNINLIIVGGDPVP